MKDTIAAARDIIILGAILLFASGWTTSFFYFQHFGISLNALEWPYYGFYLYSLLPLEYIIRSPFTSWPLPVLLVCAIILALLVFFAPRAKETALAAGFLLVLIVTFFVSREAAAAQAECTRYGGGHRSVFLALDPSWLAEGVSARTREEADALRRSVSENSAVLIAETPRHYFLLFQGRVREARSSGNYDRAPVFRVPVEAVKLARTTAPSISRDSAYVSFGGLCHVR